MQIWQKLKPFPNSAVQNDWTTNNTPLDKILVKDKINVLVDVFLFAGLTLVMIIRQWLISVKQSLTKLNIDLPLELFVEQAYHLLETFLKKKTSYLMKKSSISLEAQVRLTV